MAAILLAQQAAAVHDVQVQQLFHEVFAEWQNKEEVPQEVSTLLTGVLTEWQINDEVPQETTSLLTGLVFWLHQLLSEYEKTSSKAGKSSVHHHIAKAEKAAAVIPESFENMSMTYSWAEEELSMPLSTAEEKMSIEFGQTVKMSKAFKTKATKGVRMLEKTSKATKTHKINV